MQHYYILDTETTGLSQPKAVEVAWIAIDEDLNVLDEQVHRVNPEKPIEEGAYAIHGISDADVADCPTIEIVMQGFPKKLAFIGHNCLTGDHEVLTEGGWVRLDGLGPTVKAACWEPSDASIRFETSEVVNLHYEGEMYSYDTLFHCGVYTKDHRVYYKRAAKLDEPASKWLVATAKECATFAPNSVAIPSAGWLEPVDPLPISPDEARVLEMFRADGNINQYAVRLKFKKAAKIERAQYLLHVLGMPFSIAAAEKGATRINVLAHPIRDKLSKLLGYDKDKALGPWVLRLSKAARVAMLDEARMWDGHVSAKSSSTARSKAQCAVHTAKSEEAKWFQIAAVLTGYTSGVSLDFPNTRGFSRPDGVLSRVTLRPKQHIKTLQTPTVVQHQGLVYCLATPTGAFLVRRNGRVWVTGNCSFDQRVLGSTIEWNSDLCTLALARRWIKDSANHKLVTLKEHLGLSEQTAHSALGDCRSTLELLRHISTMSGRNLVQLIELESKPKVLAKMPYGKFKGRVFAEVPANYRNWMLGLEDLHKDIRYTLERMKVL